MASYSLQVGVCELQQPPSAVTPWGLCWSPSHVRLPWQLCQASNACTAPRRSATHWLARHGVCMAVHIV